MPTINKQVASANKFLDQKNTHELLNLYHKQAFLHEIVTVLMLNYSSAHIYLHTTTYVVMFQTIGN